jgi:hypothetical protein
VKISGFALEKIDGRLRASARMTWEDIARKESTVFLEVDDTVAENGLTCNPHAFLLACVGPALRHGERRIYLDADLCPVLKDGLSTAMSIVHDWYYREKRAPLVIEAKGLTRGLAVRAENRAAFFFSGGVDSYATLRVNRTSFPLDHSYSIKDGILVFGFEQDDPQKFEHVKDYLAPAAEACGVSLLPVYTNIYLPYREDDARHGFEFWEFEYQGLALASVAHSLFHRVSIVSISATHSHRTLRPYGSHPLLDPNYSSSDMQILHTGISLSRLEKTRLLAEWGVPLLYLRVCNQYRRYEKGALNCGECEKCLMTKLALLVLDKQLDGINAFSTADITPELLERRLRITTNYRQACYQELLDPLIRKGHHHLARVIERKLKGYKKGVGVAHSKTRKLLRQILGRLSRGF